METIYRGESIDFEEMPQGCVITPSKTTDNYGKPGSVVVVSTVKDAQNLILSLAKMIEILELRNEQRFSK